MFKAIFGLQSQQPTTVISVSQSDYESRHPIRRGNGILLYGPQISSGLFSSNKNVYDIVLPLSISESVDGAFSLFRSENEQQTEELFVVFNGVIPKFKQVEKVVTIAKLQELCDILREHRSWSIAHVYAHLGKYKCFEEECVQALINEADDVTGMTPIMVAIAAKNLIMVQNLLLLRCSLDSLSGNQNSVLHHAAVSNKDIVNCLLKQDGARKWINSFNGDGHTPLHVACINDQPDIVKALLIGGADANVSTAYSVKGTPLNVCSILKNNEKQFHADDMKYGGTPLHWCLSLGVIETLLDSNCDINAENLQGKTALHLMVKHSRLDCLVFLLCNDADSSKQDYDGNTPLHEALMAGSDIEILQALIVFGADPNIKNNKKETPRHLLRNTKNIESLVYILHVAGAERCSPSMGGCTIMCKHDGTFDGLATECVPEGREPTLIEKMMAVASMEKNANKKRPLKGGRLLCLDGGGIRGLILIQILLEIEKELKKPILNFFDWIAGTSTGGILALAITYGKTLKDCQKLYFKLKDMVFCGDRPYSCAELEKILKDNFGAATRMSDMKRAKLIITTVEGKRKPLTLRLIRNYSSPMNIINTIHMEGDLSMVEEDELIWEAARKSSAAPTYFDMYQDFVDGGLIANNPTLDALTEIMEYSLAQRAANNFDEVVQTSIVVSCGTGLIPNSSVQSLKNLSLNFSKGLFSTLRTALQLQELGTLLVDLATCTDGRVVDRARAWCSMGGIPYFRFNPQMSADVAMDETSNKTIIKMLWETKAYMFANKAVVQEVIDVLSNSKK